MRTTLQPTSRRARPPTLDRLGKCVGGRQADTLAGFDQHVGRTSPTARRRAGDTRELVGRLQSARWPTNRSDVRANTLADMLADVLAGAGPHVGQHIGRRAG